MVFKTLLKFKKIIATLLLLVILTPLFSQPVLAYDSTPELGAGDLLFLYNDEIFLPAVEDPQMNLESFVNETFKALLLGVPFYYLRRSGIGFLIQAVICGWRAQGNLIDGLTCVANAVGITDLFADIIAALGGTSQAPGQQINLAQSPSRNGFVALFRAVKNTFQMRPSSGFGHWQWWGQKLGIVQPAHAQETSFGFSALSGIIQFWSMFRNAAYALLAVALVIIGFMIMFRVKISPQAVVTIQMALPRVIVTLILVTFSYAIVGFILDLVWVVTIFIANLLGVPSDMINALTNLPLIGLFLSTDYMLRGLLGCFVLIGSYLYNTLNIGIVASLGGAGLFGWILAFVLVIALVVTMARIMWMLIKAFVYIILYAIFGPLYIFLNVFPGSKAFGSWLKNVLAQAVVFPATATLLLTAYTFMPIGGLFFNVGVIEEIAFGAAARLPLVGVLTSAEALMMISIGMILFTPKIAKTIQQLTKTLVLGEGVGIGEAIMAIPGAGMIRGIGEKAIQDWGVAKTQKYAGMAKEKVKATAKEGVQAVFRTPTPPSTPQTQLGAAQPPKYTAPKTPSKPYKQYAKARPTKNA